MHRLSIRSVALACLFLVRPSPAPGDSGTELILQLAPGQPPLLEAAALRSDRAGGTDAAGPGLSPPPPILAPALATRLAGLGLRPRRAFLDRLAPKPGRRAPAGPWGFDPARILLLEARDSATCVAAQEALAGDPAIAWVEPNRERGPAVTRVRQPRDRSPVPGAPAWDFPSDPMFRDSRQWGLRNLGPAGVYGGVAGADIAAREAWVLSVGSSEVTLALADTGVDPEHPELQAVLADGTPRLDRGLNVTSDPSPSYADSFGHGTPVAGVMAARTGEGAHFDSLGIAGVCGGDGARNPGCRLVPVKITPGHSGYARSFDIARAILYAASLGARAINVSFAGGGHSRLERLAMQHALLHGCVVVTASGNRGFADGSAPQYPAAYAADGLGIQVGASDPLDQRAIFSSHGPGLDLLAPGVDIWSTWMTYAGPNGLLYNGYAAVSGTSFAAPFATGTVGLLAAARPELADTDFQRLLRESADDVGDAGPDSLTGWGRLSAARALRAVGPGIGIWHDEAPASRFRSAGFDSLTIVEGGPGATDRFRGRVWAERIEASALVSLPDSFSEARHIWPRVAGTSTARGDFHLPYVVPWAEVANREARGFALRGYLYRVICGDTLCDADAWVPFPPDQARFGFTVIGGVRGAAAGVATPAARPGARLQATPSPARGSIQIVTPGPGQLSIFDVTGRRVLHGWVLEPAGRFVWDGQDESGGRVSPGVYLVRYDSPSETLHAKVVRLE